MDQGRRSESIVRGVVNVTSLQPDMTEASGPNIIKDIPFLRTQVPTTPVYKLQLDGESPVLRRHVSGQVLRFNGIGVLYPAIDSSAAGTLAVDSSRSRVFATDFSFRRVENRDPMLNTQGRRVRGIAPIRPGAAPGRFEPRQRRKRGTLIGWRETASSLRQDFILHRRRIWTSFHLTVPLIRSHQVRFL